MSTLTATFAVNDRVVVSALCPLENLVGRYGTVISLIPQDEKWLTKPMVEVRLDNLISRPDVPFYPNEIIKLEAN